MIPKIGVKFFDILMVLIVIGVFGLFFNGAALGSDENIIIPTIFLIISFLLIIIPSFIFSGYMLFYMIKSKDWLWILLPICFIIINWQSIFFGFAIYYFLRLRKKLKK